MQIDLNISSLEQALCLELGDLGCGSNIPCWGK